MINLIKDIRDSGEVSLILSSHLLRDVDECCDEVLILKDGEVASYCDLAEERRTNKKFVELETQGDVTSFVNAIKKLGCETAAGARRHLKVVLPEDVGTSDLFRLAEAHGVEIRRLNFKRDSLEEIFLKAMGH